MRPVLLAFLFAMVASSATAALAPEYYERARAEAPSVVVIVVERVRGLQFTHGNGECSVEGEIAAVERGDRYQVGQKVAITVPCRRANAENIATGIQFQEFGALRRSERGRLARRRRRTRAAPVRNHRLRLLQARFRRQT